MSTHCRKRFAGVVATVGALAALVVALPGTPVRADADAAADVVAVDAAAWPGRPPIHVAGPLEGAVSATDLFLDGRPDAVRGGGRVGSETVTFAVARLSILPLWVGSIVVGDRRLPFLGNVQHVSPTEVAGSGLGLLFRVDDRVRGPGEYVDRTTTPDGYTRTALVHVPPGFVPDGSAPLLLYLHGAGAPAGWTQDLFTQTRAFADTVGAVVVIPDGIRAVWNAGEARDGRPDDVAFLTALVDRVHAGFGTDSARTYAAGFSNGAAMANTLACRSPGRFAAFAALSGYLADERGCTPPGPVPVVVVHGTRDPLVELEDGAAAASFWAAHNRCTGTVDEPVPDTHADGTTAVLHRYSGCVPGGEVLFYEVAGGGHQWPGGAVFLSEALLGLRNLDLDANAAIWSFMSAYRTPG